MKTLLFTSVIALSFASGKYSSQVNYHQGQTEDHQKQVLYHQEKANHHQKEYYEYLMKASTEMSKK